MENQANTPEKTPHGGASDSGGLLNSTFLPPFSLKGWLFILAGLVPSLIVGWLLFPMVLYSSQEQPFKFSHAFHTNPDIGIEGDTELELCMNCHDFRDDGTFAGIPKLETCTMCHDDPSAAEDTEYEELKVFLKEYVAEGKEVPWLVYSRQPECVYFSHIAHVKMGNVACGTCHGDHAKSDELPVYKENRLTGYSIDIWGRNIAGYKVNTWDRMKMDDCAECHTERGHEENNACFVCHK